MSWRDGALLLVLTVAAALLLKLVVLEAYRIPSASMDGTLRVGDCLIVNKLAYAIRTPSVRLGPMLTIPGVRIPLFRSIRRGDVIVFDRPGDGPETPGGVRFIKRCVGLPGDTLEFRGGALYVNGARLSDPPHARTSRIEAAAGAPDAGPIVVPYAGMRIPLSPDAARTWSAFAAREGHALVVAGDGTVLLDGRPSAEYTVGGDCFYVLGDNRENSSDSRDWGFLPERAVVGEAVAVYWSRDPSPDAGGWSAIRWDRVGMLIR